MTLRTPPQHTRSPDPDSPNRSSVEAYIGYVIAVCTVVFEVTLSIKVFLFLFLLAFGLYLIWTYRRTSKRSPTSRRVIATIVLTGVFLGIGAPNLVTQYRKERKIPSGYYIHDYCGFTGQFTLDLREKPPKVVSGEAMFAANVDGNLLTAYRDRFTLVMVVFRAYGHLDPNDEPNISKSRAIQIEPDRMLFAIPMSPTGLTERGQLAGNPRDIYKLLAVPFGTDTTQFNTVNQFIKAGGYVIDDRSCVPPPLTANSQ
jgi:hypothetical protein